MLPEYLAKAVPKSRLQPRSVVREHRAQLRRRLPLDRLLQVPRRRHRSTSAERGRLPARAGRRRPAQLRALLLRARDARHEDRIPAVRGGQFDVRNHRRLSHARPADGPACRSAGSPSARSSPRSSSSPGSALDPTAGSRALHRCRACSGATSWPTSASRESSTSPASRCSSTSSPS